MSRPPRFRWPRAWALVITPALLAFALLVVTGCPPGNPATGTGTPRERENAPKLLSVQFDDPVTLTANKEPTSLAAARNEVVSFAIQVNNLQKAAGEKVAPVLRLQPLKRVGSDGKDAADRIDPGQFTAYQLLAMPVDLNRASFVRHTGLEQASTRFLNRALLPVPVDDGKLNLAALRNPDQPRSTEGRATAGSNRPVLLWFDLAVPSTAKADDYQATLEVVERAAVVSTLVVNLRIHDFVLPDERHLLMVGKIDAAMLRRLYPRQFETARMELMTRKDPRYAESVAVLDQLVKLGQANRAQVVVPELQPQVKWPAGAPPRVTWEDFDSVVLPWLTGSAFPDNLGLGYWPLPEVQFLHNYVAGAQAEYWAAVAGHFDQLNQLEHSSVVVGPRGPGRVAPADVFRLSEEAARILAVHPKIRVTVPLEDEQVQFSNGGNANLVDPKTVDRLVTAGAGLVFPAPLGTWPKDLNHPTHWLRTDTPGLVPFAGAGGDERDVRVWAWLAFLRNAELIQWPNTLPSRDNPDEPADPNEVTWFYPGNWFGVADPVPTVQLKWLRRAQQDYEYLYLAKQRGEIIRTLVMARLITKPVEIPVGQAPDPVYALMCGTTDAQAWRDVKQLLAESILLRPPGEAVDENKSIDLNGRTLQWAVPQEKPLLLGRTTSWGWNATMSGIDFRLGADIYNAADQRLIGQLQWSSAPAGWQFNPKPVQINPARAINVFNIRRFDMDAAIDLRSVTADVRQPVQVAFTNDLTSRTSGLQVIAPLAICDRRGPSPLEIDGKLGDWSEADAIQNGPLVRMLNRPEVQRQDVERASTPTEVYTGWSATDLYLAFKVTGVQPPANGAERNFVDYQLDRAWAEDLTELVIQPIYLDNSTGPLLHVICKPRGQLVAERKVDPRSNVNPWQSVVGEAIRYAAEVDPADPSAGTVWRGELAIPWGAINDAKHTNAHPTLLRFNFVQHKNATGESASWAGPIDYGRDGNFTGLLYVRDPANPGMKGN